MKCIKCGKKQAEIENLCKGCYSEKHPIVKGFKEPKIKKCPQCMGFFKGDKKISGVSEISSIIKKSIKPANEYSIKKASTELAQEKNQLVAIITITAGLAGKSVEQDFEIRLKIEKFLCKGCSRKAGKYYEGTLQLRNASDEIKKQAKALIETEGLSVCSEKEAGKSLDYRLSNKKKMMHVAERLKSAFGGTVERSEKLFSWDRQTSKKVHRVNILYKAPEIKKGQAFLWEQKPVQVVSIGKKTKLLDLETGKKLSGTPEKGSLLEKREGIVVQAKPALKILGKDYQPEEVTDKIGKKSGKKISYIKAGGKNYRIDDSLCIY